MKTSKIITVIFAFTLFIVGCTVENPENDLSQSQEQITISAYRADSPETKTQRDESDGSVLWTPGDAISLFYGSGTNGGSRFVSTGTEVSRVTNFTGTIGVITGGANVSVEDTYFWGLYPYDATAVCDGSSIVTTLPSQQEAVPSTFATNLFPSIGRAQGLSMGFYNICGGVRFTVTKEGLKSVTLRAIGGEPLTGKARIGFEGGIPVVKEIMESSNTVTITAPAGKYLEVGKYYYFITYPQALSQGIEMTFESFMETGTYERRTSSLTIKRSIFGTLNNVDQNVVYAQKTGNIPIEDPSFKNYLVQNYDSDGNGEISFEEAAEITEIRIIYTNDYNLQSLKGIEYMPNLEVIECPGESYDQGPKSAGIDRDHYYVGPYRNNWTEKWGPIGTLRYADVSNNPKLRSLSLQNNSALGVEMGTINVSNCPDLKHIDIGITWLEYPDISANTKLEFVQFTHLRGSLPDFSRLTKIKGLFIEWPQDSSVEFVDLDVSHMPELESLGVAGRIRSLSDLSANPKLRWLYNQHSPQFTGDLDLSACPDLETLIITSAHLETLDVTHNTKLLELNCENNLLTSLDLSNNTTLKNLNCCDNRIGNIALPNSLETILCWNNPIGTLDVSGMTNLVELACANTGLTSLNVTNNAKLVRLAFNDNQIGSINLSGNPLLEELACWNSGLTNLDLSHNPELTWLRCWGNRIESLNVSHNTKLGTRATSIDSENGLYCSPMNDEHGVNLLQSLLIASGQTIPYVTENRDSTHIPAETIISVAPTSGGGEGTGNQDW